MNILELIVKRNIHQRIFNDLQRLGEIEKAELHKQKIKEINATIEAINETKE